ncbi:MAG: 50S ribosomal protein L4 [Candidatus Omnitrophota bacterium]
MDQVTTRLSVYDLEGKVVDNFQLDEKLFDGVVNKALLYEAIKAYEANTRKGTACAKNRGEVSGGGIKPWRQKGTGRARVGSTRNPLWRHGGVVFPPKPRDFSCSMPKKSLHKALLSSLNARLLEKMIRLVVKIDLNDKKTKVFKNIITKLNVQGKALVVVDKMSENVKFSSRNLEKVTLLEGRNLNARDVLINDFIVFEKEALENLVERLK